MFDPYREALPPNSFENYPGPGGPPPIHEDLLRHGQGPLSGYRPLSELGLPHGGQHLSDRDRLEVEAGAMGDAQVRERMMPGVPAAPLTARHTRRVATTEPEPVGNIAASPLFQPAVEPPRYAEPPAPHRLSETTIDEPIGAGRGGWLVAAGAVVVTLVAGVGYALSRPDERPSGAPGAVAEASYVPNLSCKVNVVGEEGDRAYIDVTQVHGQQLGNRRVVLATLGERTIAGVAEPTGESNRYGFDPTAFRGADVAVYAQNSKASPLCGVVNVGGPGPGDEHFSGRTAPQYFEQLLPQA